MNKTFLSCAFNVCFLFSYPLAAHEFWLMPDKFKLDSSGAANQLVFRVGEDFIGNVWAKRAERTLTLMHYTKNHAFDLTPSTFQSDTIPIALQFESEGTHLLAMESNNSFISLEADKFNHYLKEDGNEAVYQWREKNGTAHVASRENYRRCAKTLVQVGTKTDDTFKRVLGMPLELIPLQNPYRLKQGDNLTVQVLFAGKPLTNKMILTWHKHTASDAAKPQTHYTDAKGLLTFPLTDTGDWMVSTVHLVPVENDPNADYQSYWGNLTFGF
ncbi:DUF4198 domain-containing protein [Methylomonas sp. HW2-6]|uniref:DUF4198 domain-containing protein n=1 Tax=Methylomonas sp. HW2-6 TaxID=3376687 RepID=UPI004042B137